MTKKKPDAKIGRPPNAAINDERLDRMAKHRACVGSDWKASELAAAEEAAQKLNPVDASRFRKLWKKELNAAEADGMIGPGGDWLYSHLRADRALIAHLAKMGLAPTLKDGKLCWSYTPG